MGICDSTKNKKKNTKETKVILPESEVMKIKNQAQLNYQAILLKMMK